MSSERDAVFDKLLAEYEREFTAFSTKLKRALSVLIKSGPQSKEEVIKFMAGSGLTDVANNFVAKYSEAIDNAARISAQTGINLVLPERSLSILALIEENQVSNILGASDAIAKTVADASLRYGIGESKLNTIIAELEASITTAGRRIVSEAVTGASIYDRTIKFEQFTNAGVEKYFYEGPYAPGKGPGSNRPACLATLEDSRQSTGWTMADIQSSQTPFITCGGYNCRHEWLPFVEGLDDLIKEMQKDAGIIESEPPVAGGGIKKGIIKKPKTVKAKHIPELEGFDPNILKQLMIEHEKTGVDVISTPIANKFQDLAIALGRKYKKQLTQSEIDAIDMYKGGGYEKFNELARSSYYRGYVGDVKKIKKDFTGTLRKSVLQFSDDYLNLISAVNKGQLNSDMILYRGMQGAPENILDMVGQTLKDKAFWSTSLDPDMAKSYMSVDRKGALLKIRAKKGHSASFPEAIYPRGESEILLNKANFKITKVIDKDKYWLVEGDLL